MPACWWYRLWQCSIHCPGLLASRSTANCSIGRTITVSLRGPTSLPARVWTWKLWPCRCTGWNIIDWLASTRRTRSPSRTCSGIASSKVRPLIVQRASIIPPDSTTRWVRSGGRGGTRATSGPHHPERLALLAFGNRDQREHAVAQGDDRVVALTHADHQRVHHNRGDGQPVAVGHREPMAAKRKAEGGLGGGVDDA